MLSEKVPSQVASAAGHPSPAVRSDTRAKQVSIRDLGKTYPTLDGDVVALRGATFDVAAGEFVSVLGPSGCGKSTLMLIAAGLDAATSGSVLIGNVPVTKPVTDIGIVFQEHALYDWRTVLQNIMLQAEIRRLPRAQLEERAQQLLQRTGLADFAHKYPFELSGGMRQRAAICRALVHDPDFLFFDEPFGALDALTREQMRIDLEKLWLEKRQTVLFITHSIPEAVALSDRIVVMTPRPGEVDVVIPIDLPRPRDKAVIASEAFAMQCEKIIERFMARGVIQY